MDDTLPFDNMSERHVTVKPKFNILKYTRPLAMLLVCIVGALLVYKFYISKKAITIPDEVVEGSPHRKKYIEKFAPLTEIKIGDIINNPDHTNATTLLNGMECYENMVSNTSAPISNASIYRMLLAMRTLNPNLMVPIPPHTSTTVVQPPPTVVVPRADTVVVPPRTTTTVQPPTTVVVPPRNDVVQPPHTVVVPQQNTNTTPVQVDTHHVSFASPLEEVDDSPVLILHTTDDDATEVNVRAHWITSMINMSPMASANVEEIDED